ncbi:TetR/AcrR family transcriptional regulator [Streptomyces sp. MS2.AVA.5]|uniref:TetR/AcrR family transcriptional regulator n=1 Tax=Streptomyces achmelvichensis TaxID=3134111 RepID=A0ACC6Q2X9_9ACTN
MVKQPARQSPDGGETRAPGRSPDGSEGNTPARAPDGRTERGRQTREKIADALLALLDEGEAHFSADRVAERAGVSRRLVFHHFADMSQVIDTAITRRLEQLFAQIKPLPTDGPRSARVAAMAEQRARILEWMTPTRLAIMRQDQPSERVEQVTREVYGFARDRLAEIFAVELDRLPADRRADLLNGLDGVTTWGAWYHWRSSGLDTATARRAMETTVHALLATTDAPASASAPTP